MLRAQSLGHLENSLGLLLPALGSPAKLQDRVCGVNDVGDVGDVDDVDDGNTRIGSKPDDRRLKEASTRLFVVFFSSSKLTTRPFNWSFVV